MSQHPEHSAPTAGGRAPQPLASFLFAAALGLGLTVLAGCGKPPGNVGGDPTNPGVVKGKPWEAASKRLRKDPDLAGCKAALSGLSSDLKDAPDAPKPKALSSEAEAALKALVPLAPFDLDEVRGASFSSHDPVYLAD
jgi:hypothetical protein